GGGGRGEGGGRSAGGRLSKRAERAPAQKPTTVPARSGFARAQASHAPAPGPPRVSVSGASSDVGCRSALTAAAPLFLRRTRIAGSVHRLARPLRGGYPRAVRWLNVLFALLVNAVPVYGVLVEGWSAATI